MGWFRLENISDQKKIGASPEIFFMFVVHVVIDSDGKQTPWRILIEDSLARGSSMMDSLRGFHIGESLCNVWKQF